MKISEYQPGFPDPDLHDTPTVTRYPLNERGRDFVVGDIHGMFSYLEVLLKEAGFREDTDRIFSVGDLVDRGPESDLAVQWLKKPWFHACRGNHEQFALDSVDPEQMDIWTTYNGGEWWLDLDPVQQQNFRDVFNSLPMVMEVQTGTGTVGVVHADVPPLLTWEQFVELLESGHHDAIFYALWSRTRIQQHCTTSPVEGNVERIYCGHTPTRRTTLVNNVYYIDTGAVYRYEGYRDASLTLVEIQPERHREYLINTNQII
jgi:serine/threonine protein phosphatase 1